MKIEVSKVTQLKISDIPFLDLINVYLENINTGGGRIIIECCGKGVIH